MIQRKLSRRKSTQSSRGIFSRKPTKKADSQSIISSNSVLADDRASVATGKGKEQEKYSLDENPPPRAMFPARSIIPDPLNELPSWYTQAAEDSSITTNQYRSRYPMHNPVGPRWYKNWHLHPSTLENRPPSFFSPSFPPMATNNDRNQDSKIPGPSRTPSGSPLPTPNSSQTRIHDVRARSRKASLTAHDTVDMLDVTDPWGTNWHHQSPYDLGGDRPNPDTASEVPVSNRHRRMSMTTGSRHKSTVPSPLSQSTSAVNLQAATAPAHIPTRESRNRKPFEDLFSGPQENGHASKRASEPPPLLSAPVQPLKRGSTTGPSLLSPSLSDKKEKRGSILGRLAKRFSVMRKPDRNRSSATVAGSDTHSIMNGRPSIDTLPVSPIRSTPSPQKPSLHHAKSSDGSRRVAPPSLPSEPPTPLVETPPNDVDVTSISSFDEPYHIGKLTIANPDEPAPPTPAEDIVPLPPLPSEAAFGGGHLNGILDHRLSTILSVDAPGTSPSPPLPELPPVTPSVVATKLFAEPSLPPTPEGTRPPTPVEAPPPAPAPAPGSPTLSNGTHARNALSYAMSPSSLASLPSTDDLPLSRASMLVEPPTPHAPAMLIPAQSHAPPMPSPEQVLQSNGAHRDRDPSPSKRDSQKVKSSSSSTKSRRTETFKLIRSASGNVQPVGESIIVEGEHWEVVADAKKEEKKSRKERSKSSDTEAAPSRRESKRVERERGSTDDASDKKSRDRHRKSVNGRSGSDHAGRSSTYSEADTIRQSTAERRKSSTKERRESKGDVVRSTQTPVAPPTHSKSMSGSSATRRERRTSSTAKEAWDLERLWKGRSMMYGPDGTTVVSTRPTIGSDSRPSTIMSPDLHRAMSIPSTPTSSYEQIPIPSSHQLQSTKSTTTRTDHKLYRSFPDSVPFPSNRSSNNPLPEPPRLSLYTAAPLPPSIASSGDGPSSSDYWTKYAGVATTSTNH
ncbi:hypothetical protein EIP91_000572 [Steccherinum ochraceum]|uniref:Uncharacterized protein n=1 Tax=Steccherinum ochraceum TaxID=92696 RepID=A0A4R0RP67_9APHY|nr:hypothetical protein EIP91_000572 [Steccherinum ochraceum]